MNRFTIALFAATLFAAPGFAAEEAAKPLIPADSFNPAILLPAPPQDGAGAARAELEELRALEKSRTPGEFNEAAYDNAHEDITPFSAVVHTDLTKLPETVRLFALVKAETKAAGKLAKDRFKRNRPWIADTELKTCTRDDPPQSSYPSGHSTLGFAFAVVLAKLAPDYAGDVMERARLYAYHRMVCSMHYRMDIVAGEVLGTVIGYALLQNPEFQAQAAKAHAELVAAGVTK